MICEFAPKVEAVDGVFIYRVSRIGVRLNLSTFIGPCSSSTERGESFRTMNLSLIKR
jgi:hypothetical protein